MRLHGTTIADLGGDGEFQYTTLLAGITEIGLNTPGLRLAIHLFEVMSYPDPADKNKVTAQYKSEFEFIQKRVRWLWTRVQLTKGKKSMVEVGLLREIDGDWHLDISVIPRNQLTSKRRKNEEEASKAPKAAEAPAPKALAEGTAPVVTVTHEVVRPAKAPEPVPAKPAPKKEPPKIQRSEREKEFDRRIKEKQEDEAKGRRFGAWFNATYDRNVCWEQLWDDRDRYDYQGYLESLKPKPQPKPEPVPVGVSSDDGEQW